MEGGKGASNVPQGTTTIITIREIEFNLRIFQLFHNPRRRIGVRCIKMRVSISFVIST